MTYKPQCQTSARTESHGPPQLLCSICRLIQAPSQQRDEFAKPAAELPADRCSFLSLKRRAVHPRVCWEQQATSPGDSAPSGSSPRVRGTVGLRLHIRGPHRFIPACAGNRRTGRTAASARPVHPRVCGEQTYPGRVTDVVSGSSPRVRGTGPPARTCRRPHRFIPACAGNRAATRLERSSAPVHPRVCGEQSSRRASPSCAHGSSPRVRGTGEQGRLDGGRGRFIPACAGNSHHRPRRVPWPAVHPRVCGEQCSPRSWEMESDGSSPRVRGTVFLQVDAPARCRFIPACAGNSDEAARSARQGPVHPRVCGEQLSMSMWTRMTTGSSPRVRGTGTGPEADLDGVRFIPACAGNRRCTAIAASMQAVHPRVCGEQEGCQ